MATEHDTRPPSDLRSTTASDPRATRDPHVSPTTRVPPDPYVAPEPAASSRAHVHVDPEKRSGYGTIAFIVGGLVVAVLVLFLFFGRGTSPEQTVPATSPGATAPAESTAPLVADPAPAVDEPAPAIAPVDDAAPAPADEPAAPATEEPAPID